MKTCKKCGGVFPHTEFYKMGNGLAGKCKECYRADVRACYVASRDKRAEYERRRSQTPERKKQAAESQQRRRTRHPDKEKARRTIGYHIRAGNIPRGRCEVCGSRESQAHHHDYSKPLDVRWLCFKHHREEHGQTVIAA